METDLAEAVLGPEQVAEMVSGLQEAGKTVVAHLMVDFLCNNEDPIGVADRLSSVLLSVSGHHSGYGLPAPLIEADNVAKLSDQEVENFYSHILSFAGNIPSVMKLRRDQRPF